MASRIGAKPITRTRCGRSHVRGSAARFDPAVDTASLVLDTRNMTSGGEHLERLQRARLALDGLSVGDAFGERFFGPSEAALGRVRQRALPRPPWKWTDDTAMALSVVDVLEEHGGIDRDALAAQFARRYAMDRNRGYGRTAHDILHRIGLGESWRAVAPAALGGEGSCGNGAAMRVAPVGGYFADDLAGAAAHAVASAEPTHSHPEGKAGAIAVAITAAVAWQIGQGRCSRGREALFVEVLRWTPTGETRDGIRRAAEFGPDEDVQNVASAVGNGSRVLAQDTVPLCIWCAARHLDSFESALWTTVAALGDRDTTCAIVGGIVALAVGPRGIPKDWLGAREPIEGA